MQEDCQILDNSRVYNTNYRNEERIGNERELLVFWIMKVHVFIKLQKNEKLNEEYSQLITHEMKKQLRWTIF